LSDESPLFPSPDTEVRAGDTRLSLAEVGTLSPPLAPSLVRLGVRHCLGVPNDPRFNRVSNRPAEWTVSLKGVNSFLRLEVAAVVVTALVAVVEYLSA